MVRLSRLELRVMEILWTRGACSIREMLQGFPAKTRPAYSTVQTIVYRLEAKRAVRRGKKVVNADIFEPVVSRGAAHRLLIEDFLGIFGGRMEPLMAYLIDSGKLTLEHIQKAEHLLRTPGNRRSPK
jgi:BlaI family transcriptional regulator, penicillinase repressor